MGTGFRGALWGLGAVAILAMGLFVCGDHATSHPLTCTDLLNLPIEDLMEVHIVSKVGGPASEHTSVRPLPSAIWEAPFEPSNHAVTVS